MSTALPLPEACPLLPLFPEAAEPFQMSRTRAYALSKRGAFPIEVLRVGGRLMVRTADLRRYLGLDVPGE